MLDWLFQYILGYCTSWGLAAIGEPPLPSLTKSLPLAAIGTAAAATATQARNNEFKEPTPAWIIPIFMVLVAGRYITSFLVSFFYFFFMYRIFLIAKRKEKKNLPLLPLDFFVIFFRKKEKKIYISKKIAYVFQVISTVMMVSTADDTSIRAAAYAVQHPLVATRRENSSSRQSPQKKKAMTENEKEKENKNKNTTTTTAVDPNRRLKRSLTRQMTIPIESLGKKFFNLPYLRGLSAFLTLSITQWFFSTIGDFLLSGQPKELKAGYGSTSIILAVFFGGTSALWTHYAITRPRNIRKIEDHFPRGQELLVELYPITTLWALCEQMVRSLPLALSRSSRIFGLPPLGQYAWTPELWNTLDASAQRILLFKFAVLFLFYLFLVAALSIPASITLRRIHASMLRDADEAIVPFVHGNPKPRRDNDNDDDGDDDGDDDDDQKLTQSPGLSVSEAWATLNWSLYVRGVRVFVIYWIVNQALHLLCWKADLLLNDLFDTHRYASAFPSRPTTLTLRFLH